uniref:Uncharacterized protein n=1 Tax=Pyramimonas orientalis virus TaxID=455367 RepID=A0A7M3UNX7_POV01|nr:hypothetical protein HWQ62_00286 [Pyramimonas orientalis virus]
MIVVILKNTLLIILIVLIIHFMIKNRMLDELDTFKRKMVHDDTRHDGQYHTSHIKPTAMVSGTGSDKPDSQTARTKKVHFDDKDILPECTSVLSCDDFKLTDKDMPELASKESKMKELYDFVFHEDSTVETSLNAFFPNDVTDESIVDKTEIDQHHKEKESKFVENKNAHCNFEVIGVIESVSDADIYGLDSLTSTNFSNI